MTKSRTPSVKAQIAAALAADPLALATKTKAAKPTAIHDGAVVTFGSKIEHARWTELTFLQTAGLIRNLKPHPSFVLQEPFVNEHGQSFRDIVYTPDAEYDERIDQPGLIGPAPSIVDDGYRWRHVIEEVKVVEYDRAGRRSTPTESEATRLRYKLLAYRYPAYYLNIVYREQPRGPKGR